ncbi:MAG: hypothetical protein KAW12_23980, partial [Candidatus Aminicenantes bacterium]|nr:hypothetical protein [Candidatus Aminicenantes bacterium]
MQIENLETIYNERIENNNLKIKKLKTKDRLFIAGKLLLFSGAVVLFFNFSRLELKLSFTIFAVLFFLFAAAALFHEKILRKIDYFRTLNRINENELKTLKEQFLDGVACGEEFIDREHFYTSDLDIFGERSLFHYVNRTVTPFGYGKLGRSLQEPCGTEEIAGRQVAVEELSGKLDFRHNLQAHGMKPGGGLRYDLAGDVSAAGAVSGAGNHDANLTRKPHSRGGAVNRYAASSVFDSQLLEVLIKLFQK